MIIDEKRIDIVMGSKLFVDSIRDGVIDGYRVIRMAHSVFI
jgi:hypothetical protein